ncbi:PREDICTED: transmembrane 7 superfamily member 3-like [Ceratosolen solmsi marchali]|uniref:Transmembrane 7 superfamily member 3-like n=1 Tax=Ceratosolen solmsi marchali TaxID=326594 RepID=A0AAJ6YK64_9HYME|nr:PREDICTED: transmembrane 7 superfamily member 3-like [Ceratosolen solmsi marchali]
MIRIFYESLILLICSYLLYCKGIKIPEKSLHVSNGDIKIISLSNYSTSILEEQAFMHLININNHTNFIIHISDIPEKVSFIIIQVHTYVYSVLLSYDRNIIDEVPRKYVNGTNIGLFIKTNKNNTEVYVTNKNSFIVHGLIAVVAYTKNAPYPGGCNMEFNIEKSPFQKLVYNKDIIIVDAQPASIPIIGNIQPLCENHPVQHDTYRMYISEHDFSKESYFLSISQMLTVQSIKKNANFIPMSLFGSKMRRMYSLYPGTGSVYGIVSHIANYSSAYVPIFTYGYAASPLSMTDKVFSILSFILGVFLATCGSYYNDISMFFVTMMFGAYFGYIFIIILSSYTGIVVTDILLLAIFLGILASLLWFFLRLKSTIPSMVVLVITLGTFLFNIFYFTIPGIIANSDGNITHNLFNKNMFLF